MTSKFCQILRSGPAALALLLAPAPAVWATSSPSLVLVTLDTTRADHLGPYGDGQAETPSLDQLAASGALFEHAYATTPVTLPSHASILTGLYPPQHGVRNNGTFYLDRGSTTLAELLSGQGYDTAAFVSASVLDRRYGLDQGFDLYDDDLSGGKPKTLRMIVERPAEVTVKAALQWLDRRPPDEPYFLWVHLFDPHLAYEPPPPYDARFRTRPYAGEIAYVDTQLGRLLGHRRVARREETVVVVMADHGEGLGDHEETSHAMLVYDSTLRIPWIVRTPGGTSGARLPHAVSQVDLLPTVLDLLEIEVSHEPALAGRSQAARIQGHTGKAQEDRALYAETLVPFYAYGWAKLHSVRSGKWKLIDAPTPELYDLASDPAELENVFTQNRRVAQLLDQSLEEIIGHEPGRSPSSLPVDLAAEERLRSLGYVSSSRGTTERPGVARPDPKAVMDLHGQMERAEHLLFQREFGAAARALRSVLTRDQNNLTAIKDLAAALGELGRFDEALRASRRALELSPQDPGLHLALATLEAAGGRPAQALEAVETALALDPRLVDARVEQAAYLNELDRVEEAIAVLEEALEENPHHARLNVRYAEFRELPAGELEAAERRVRRAVAREPFLALGWEVLGRVLERAGRSADAAEAYGQGLLYQPRQGRLHARLGLLRSRVDANRDGQEMPEHHLRLAIDLLPGLQPELHNALAEWLQRTGRGDDARQEYETVLAMPTSTREIRHQRARALFRLGRLEEAKSEWTGLLAQDQADTAARNNLASLALQKGDWETARGLAQRSVEDDPGLASGWNHLAVALEELGRFDEALVAYATASQADPTYWQGRFNHGLLLKKLRRYGEAIQVFAEVLATNPNHAKSHYELSLLYGGPLANPAKAIEHLRACLEAEPHHPRAARVREMLKLLGAP